MDIPRYILIAASALLTIILLGEWTRFTAEQKDSALQSIPMVTTDHIVSDRAFLDKTKLRDSKNSDIPEVLQIEAQEAKLLSNSDVLDSELISVITDTLNLIIDLNGGDIVGVALPQYPKTLENLADAFVLLERNSKRHYVAQSGLIGPDGIDHNGRARFSTSERTYRQDPGKELIVTLRLLDSEPGISVFKYFKFLPNSYVVSVEYEIFNETNSLIRMVPFAQLKRDSSEAPKNSDSGMGMKPFLGAALTRPDQRFAKFSFDDIEDAPFQSKLEGGWVAMLQHYFVAAWVPNPQSTHNFQTRRTTEGFNIIGYTSPPLTIAPQETAFVTNQLYAGPKNQRDLANLAPHLDLVVDYGWLWWLAQPLFWLLMMIQSVVINWGLAIIILTVLVKLAFFQLSAAGYRSMARMRKVQPRILAIREEHANDKAKQSQAMMDLYKKEKINPLGGCLPILIQMPVFIALYWVLMESVELRQAPLALWINDLSAMDPYFVLPILMGASMYYMQKLNPAPPDPMQAKIMQWMPIVFTFFFLWFPAGLVLYWLSNNLLSMAQQYLINRQIESTSNT